MANSPLTNFVKLAMQAILALEPIEVELIEIVELFAPFISELTIWA